MRSAALFIHPRDEILQAIQRIYRYRMTTTSGGNLSIRGNQVGAVGDTLRSELDAERADMQPDPELGCK